MNVKTDQWSNVLWRARGERPPKQWRPERASGEVARREESSALSLGGPAPVDLVVTFLASKLDNFSESITRVMVCPEKM